MFKFDKIYKKIINQNIAEPVVTNAGGFGRDWTDELLNQALEDFEVWPQHQKNFILNFTRPYYTKTGKLARNSFLLNEAGIQYFGPRVKPTTPFRLKQDRATFSQYMIQAYETFIFAVAPKTDWRTQDMRDEGGNHYYIIQTSKDIRRNKFDIFDDPKNIIFKLV